MDSSFATHLFFSILFFAPGVILFAGLAFVGVLMILEKTVFTAQQIIAVAEPQKPLDLQPTANPAPGPIVQALKQSVTKPAAKFARDGEP